MRRHIVQDHISFRQVLVFCTILRLHSSFVRIPLFKISINLNSHSVDSPIPILQESQRQFRSQSVPFVLVCPAITVNTVIRHQISLASSSQCVETNQPNYQYMIMKSTKQLSDLFAFKLQFGLESIKCVLSCHQPSLPSQFFSQSHPSLSCPLLTLVLSALTPTLIPNPSSGTFRQSVLSRGGGLVAFRHQGVLSHQGPRRCPSLRNPPLSISNACSHPQHTHTCSPTKVLSHSWELGLLVIGTYCHSRKTIN